MFVLRGKRREIIKAVEFIRLVDKPKLSSRDIALYKSIYVDTETLIERLGVLLQQEGISVGVDKNTNSALSIVPLPNIGALTLFANKEDVIQRALFWIKTIDQPEEGDEIQYFIYQPQFSRAADLGDSLEALIGAQPRLDSTTSANSQNNQKNSRAASRATGLINSNVGLVVDERANSLIFQTTGEEYKKLRPLIKRLDIMPKQIILEVLIAEVKLTEEFKQGVEFGLTNSGADIIGGYDLTSGTGGLSYILTGTKGSIDVNLFQKNQNVNVLSRPSLLVRDGVEATITVGDDIPTVGEILSDPVSGNRQSVVYRKTGVDLSVTPTINAQGVVIMEISQKISNQAPGDDSVAGSPIIFERNISTEVVADSGQTIILGGLIAEDRTVSDTGVPGLSEIPLLGGLFESSSDVNTKTELIILVTPKVVEESAEWQHIKQELYQGLSQIEVAY
nr:secretin N-terminal domain-containing protein [Marinifaba aquimaris]